MIRIRHLFLSCALSWAIAASTSQAQSAATLAADIPPQPLRLALAAFARQTDLQLVYVSAIAEIQQSKGARAGQSLPEALSSLLDHAGLRFEFLNAQTVRIFISPPDRLAPPRAKATPGRHASRLAAASAFALEEVVVTATRRNEQANRVPISMAVWTQAEMDASGVRGMSEIGELTPGVEFDFDVVVGSADYTNLVIRGVTDRHGTTTAVYYDDTPLPAARGDTFARSFPWSFDLDHVEVLRGPQGALLGQGALGGAVRLITRQPSLTTFSTLARAEIASTARGGVSYEAGAAVGGPLITDVLGLRVSGWYRTDGGFVDRINPFTGATVEGNSNRQRDQSARIALTWAPTGALRITPALDYESFGIRDSPAFYLGLSEPGVGQLRNGSLVQTPYSDSFYLGTVKLNAGFSRVDLSAVSSYFYRTAAVSVDWSPDDPVSYADAATLPVELKQRMFSQELRLASADSSAASTWIAGALYSTTKQREASRIVSALGTVDGANATVISQSRQEVFGEVGLRVTSRLSVSLGARVGRSDYDAVTQAPPIFRARDAETWATPRFNLSYKTDEHDLFFLTIAKGYRGGGVYPAVPCGGPDVFPSDSVWSYEIGAKNDLRDGWVHLESSLFHITWFNDQPDALFLGSCSSLTGRRTTAASSGLEFAARVLVSDHLRFDLALAYADARYTRALTVGDAVIVRKGDAVGAPPLVPSPLDVTTSIGYKIFLAHGVTADLRAEEIFHDRNPGPFFTDITNSPFYNPTARTNPATNKLNLRGVVRWPHFSLSLFVDNVLDAQPTLSVRTSSPDSTLLLGTTFRPRTVGLSGAWRL